MTTTDTATPFHLRGNYRPVPDEITAFDLPVTGELPDRLRGQLLRNGPNPRGASGHWFLGDGMVHGLRLEDGRATAYRNRWVRTRKFTHDAPFVRPDLTFDLTAGAANTHVVRHAGRTLALVETCLPYELTPELDTVGPHDFDGRLTTGMTAHPKVCPDTGELHFQAYGFGPPCLTYHVADASGRLVSSRPIDVDGPTMVHDMALTRHHVVFLDLPMVFDLEAALRGTMPYRFDPTYGARLGVLPRDRPDAAVRWFDVEPCYVFHVLNAFDTVDAASGEADRVVLDVVRYERLWAGDPDEFAPSNLWRWELDLVRGTARETRLDDRDVEFPRIDDRLTGRFAGRGWVVSAPSLDRPDASGSVTVYGLPGAAAGRGSAPTEDRYSFGPGRAAGEAVFAPADDTPGGPGWLLTYVYDAGRDTSDLVVLDADDVSAGPVARVHLPRRVPFGFHGSWLPDD